MGDPVTPYVEQEGSSLLTSLRPAQDAVEIKTKITATASSLALPPHRFTESSTTSSRSAPPIQRAWPQRTVMTAPHSPSRATVEKNNNQPHLPTAHPHNHHPHTHLSTLNRQVSAHSSTFNQRTLESIRTTGLHARRSSTVDDVITELPSSKIPVTPTLDSSIFRRRFSSPSVAGPSPLKVKKSLDQLHSPTSPDRRRPKFTSRLANEPSSHSWLGSSHLAAPSLHAKVNKSDDEREVDDVEKKKAPGQTKRRNWWGTSLSRGRASGVRDAPLISMTPPPSTDPNPGLMGPPLPVPTGLSPPRQSTWSTSPSRIRPTLPSLTPLPQDPNNILPLSLPATPLPSSPVSRNSTPYHTPRPSVHDLTSEFKADYAVPSASSISGRTSTSTNSSMLGWGSCTGRSDSRSSADDDGSPVSGHGKSWWWANHAGSQDVPVSPKLAGPSTLQAPRIIRMASANRFLPTGTRNWAWLLELISGTFGSRSSDSASVTGSSSSRQRLRERERLMSNYPVRKKQSATFSGRVMVFVPTSPWSIVSRRKPSKDPA